MSKVEGMSFSSSRYIKMTDWRFKQGWDNNKVSMQEVEVFEIEADSSEKKTTKRKVVPIVIQSSDDEPIQMYVRKKKQSSRFPQRYQIQRTEVNLLEFQPKKRGQDEKLLKVEESIYRTMGKQADYRALLAYKTEGSGVNRFVCELYLEERIKKYAAEDLKRQQEKESTHLQQRGRAIRYFQQAQQPRNRLIKCYRCNKKGHIAKNCLIEPPMFRCINCLGNHPHTQCAPMRCFRCNKEGHMAKNCFQDALTCSKCGMNGHNAIQCGAIILQSKFKMKEGIAFDREDTQRLRCLAGCSNPNGHFNCHTYSSYAQQRPYKDASRPRPMRSQLLENKMCFTDYDGQLAFVRTIPTSSCASRQRRVSKWY